MAKNTIATVRVTDEEAAVLRARFGSLPAALRVLIDAELEDSDDD